MVEFSLVVPIILTLVFAIIAFGILYEDKIAMDNAARDGVRWATQNPDAWDNTTSAAPASIQGQIQNEGGTIGILNSDISNINYYTVDYTASPLTPVLCGSYITANGTFLYGPGSPASGTSLSAASPFMDPGGCLVEGNLIKVTVKHTFPLPIPIISAFFKGGVTLEASATMTEEVSGL